jgi:2-keto-4-pentenoate hydratase/2-oxohepta-3-ene-1,7-dioic acid hydratase in catechol pathway
MKVGFKSYITPYNVQIIICAVELGLVIGKGGRNISQDDAESHIAGYGE